MTTTPHDDESRNLSADTNGSLTDDQQVLLTTAALKQLDAGSDEVAAAEQLQTGPQADAAHRLTAETEHVAAAAKAAVATETAALADDPARQRLRRAVLAAIAEHGQQHQPVKPQPPAAEPPRRRRFGWMSLMGSLAAAVLVMVVLGDRLWVSINAPAPSSLSRPEHDEAQETPRFALSEPQSGAKDGDAVSELGRTLHDFESRPLAGKVAAVPGSSMQKNVPAPVAAPTEVAAPAAPASDPQAASSATAGPSIDALAMAEQPALDGRVAGAGGPMGKARQQARQNLAFEDAEQARVAGLASRRGLELRAEVRSPARLAEADKVATTERMAGDHFEGELLNRDRLRRPGVAGEEYAPIVENPLRNPLTEPLSTFSVDVDTASYANVRRFLTSGRRPPRDAVRIEELINYFSYDDPAPTGDDPFAVSLEAAASPWHVDRLVVRVGLKARDIDRRERPAGNLVFLVDVSGSMSAANKLPLVKQSLKLLVGELGPTDRISLVTYAGNAALRLPPTAGDDKETILAAIDGLASGGSTHGSAGIEMAYAQAAEHFVEGGVNRVLLATDGDLNVGVTSNDALEALIREKATGGVFLTVLGFGEGNLQDAKMERIADKGNGIYAYIDGLREARKVLVEQLTGSTITVAKDVKLQVEFNPATVSGYRLIGYENRLLAAEDFRDDTKDAGEIGAGHSVTALYEIVPRGVAPGRGAEPLKYQQQPEPAVVLSDDGEPSSDLLTVKLRWKLPAGSTSTLAEFPLAERGGSFEAASADLRFASAVASFGMLLRGSAEAGAVTFSKTAQIASDALGADAGGYRTEFVDLVRKAGGN
jgi:secreted protein with Ig-like and vWFA domain